MPSVVKPPLAGLNLPFEEWTVAASTGDTLFYKSGSIILFPPNAFVDKDGRLIKGDVQVKYREFSDPIDFFISGIPMDYDSAGKRYNFESSGMCEILAYQDGVPVFVNPASKPEINLVASKNIPGSYYFLDTVQGKWVNKGATIDTYLSPTTVTNTEKPFTTLEEIVDKPVKPLKADASGPIMKILIDSASFKELMVYDNLRFQLDTTEKKFNAADSAEVWANIGLQKSDGEDLYVIKFSNNRRTALYKAKPVFQGRDYDKALKVFEKKNKAYKIKMEKRMRDEKMSNERMRKKYVNDSLAYEKSMAEVARIERLNRIIEKRNREIEKKIDSLAKRGRQIAEANMSSALMKSFQIDGFGIYNVDKPQFMDAILILADFYDKENNKIELSNVAVIDRRFNGLIYSSNNKIWLVRKTQNMIVGIYRNRIAYFSFKDYEYFKIDPAKPSQSFVMNLLPEDQSDYEHLKAVYDN